MIKNIVWKQMGVATEKLAWVLTDLNFQPGKFEVISTPDPARVIVIFVASEHATPKV